MFTPLLVEPPALVAPALVLGAVVELLALVPPPPVIPEPPEVVVELVPLSPPLFEELPHPVMTAQVAINSAERPNESVEMRGMLQR